MQLSRLCAMSHESVASQDSQLTHDSVVCHDFFLFASHDSVASVIYACAMSFIRLNRREVCVCGWHAKVCVCGWHAKVCVCGWHAKVCVCGWHAKVCVWLACRANRVPFPFPYLAMTQSYV